MKTKIQNIATNIGWFLGVVFGIGSLSLLTSGDLILGIITLLIALCILPISRSLLIKYIPKLQKLYLNATAGILLLGLITNAIILNQNIAITLDDYYPNGTYTTEINATTISGTAQVLDEISVTITQQLQTQVTTENLIIPVVDNTFSFEVPTRNVYLGNKEYKTTKVAIDYFGDLTFNRELNEEELVQRNEKKEAIAQAQAEKIAKQEAEEEAYRNSPEGKICTENPLWTKEICKVIAEGKVRIGMTRDQVIASWGKPQDINTTTSVGYTKEQWVYGNYQYLYFYDGILTTIQQ